jgi:hypothetical protein
VEHDTELTVRSALARIDGDTARIDVITDRGRVTLRMHRLVLGGLGGAIARALWPKVGDEMPTIAGSEPHDVPIQPASQELDEESIGAASSAELQDVPIQPASEERDEEPIDTQAGIADTPVQDEAQEPAEVLAAFEALWPEGEETVDPSAGVAPVNIPTQPEMDQTHAELASLADAEPHEDPASEPPVPQHKATSATSRRKRRS